MKQLVLPGLLTSNTEHSQGATELACLRPALPEMGMLVVLLEPLHHPQAHADRVSANIEHKGPQPDIKGDSGCRALLLL